MHQDTIRETMGNQDMSGIKQDMTRDTIYYLEALIETNLAKKYGTKIAWAMSGIPWGYMLKASNFHSTR